MRVVPAMAEAPSGAPARWSGRVGAAGARRLRPAGRAVAGGLRAAWSYRAVRVACPLLAATLTLSPPLALVHHVYFDRSDLPELVPFVLFQPPTTGEVTDARGEVLIQLAREYRRILEYDEMPLVIGRPSWPRRTRTSSPTPGSTTARSRAWSGRPWRARSRRGGTLRAPTDAPPGRLDAHPAARARLLPAPPDRPQETAAP